MSMIIISDASCAVEQLQDVDAKSGVDYAGTRVQEGEGQIGEYAAYGMERIGRWGMRVTATELHRMYRRSRRIVHSINPRLPRRRLPMPNHKRLPPAKKMLNAPRQTARGSMNASQKAMRILKKNFQNTVRYTKTILKSITAAIKVQQLPRYCGTPSDSKTRRLHIARSDTSDRAVLYHGAFAARQSEEWQSSFC